MQALEIEGVKYIAAASVTQGLGVTRQTLWRWRLDGKIPQGHRFRNRRLFFTETEVESISEFANRIEPIETQVNNGSTGQPGFPHEDEKSS